MAEHIPTRQKKKSDYSNKVKMRDAIKLDSFLITMDRIRKCARCGYDKHVEICHIKPVSEFSDDVPIGVINHTENLLLLCPNCHWEMDHPDDSKKICPICKKGKYAHVEFCIDCQKNVQIETLSSRYKGVNYVPATNVNIPNRDVLEKYISEHTLKEIGCIFGVGASTIKLWMIYYNLPIMTRSEVNKLTGKRRQYDKPDLLLLQEMRKTMSYKAISDKFDVSDTTIKNWLKSR